MTASEHEGSDGLDVATIRRLEHELLPRAVPGHDHVVWREAHGSTITTVDGRRIIDFTSGVLITNVGHAHPHVTAAIEAQARRGLNTFLAPHPLRAAYAERLVRTLGPGFEKVAFLSSGAEAVDTAVRIARIATGRRAVIAFTDSYHGKTSSTATFSGLPSARPHPSEPDDDVVHVPYPDSVRVPLGLSPDDLIDGVIEEVHRGSAAAGGTPACILFEPYLGSGGAIAAPPGFALALRHAADRVGALLIYDEVQSGFGRTGPLFAFQGDGVRPDLIALAKGIASGIPMAVVSGSAELLDAPSPGTLWNSFGGGPLACAAAHATLDLLTVPGLSERVGMLSEHLRSEVMSWALPHLLDVRGIGLSLGIDVVKDRMTMTPDPERALALVLRAGERGVALLGAAGSGRNIVRIAPPLLISDEEFSRGMAALKAAAHETLGADTWA